MTQCGKGSSRRGTSKEEMKRFESNYDSIFRNKPEVILCCTCSDKADWLRITQFSGNHPFCNLHAKLEKDFNSKNADWENIEDN